MLSRKKMLLLDHKLKYKVRHPKILASLFFLCFMIYFMIYTPTMPFNDLRAQEIENNVEDHNIENHNMVNALEDFQSIEFHNTHIIQKKDQSKVIQLRPLGHLKEKQILHLNFEEANIYTLKKQHHHYQIETKDYPISQDHKIGRSSGLFQNNKGGN